MWYQVSKHFRTYFWFLYVVSHYILSACTFITRFNKLIKILPWTNSFNPGSQKPLQKKKTMSKKLFQVKASFLSIVKKSILFIVNSVRQIISNTFEQRFSYRALFIVNNSNGSACQRYTCNLVSRQIMLKYLQSLWMNFLNTKCLNDEKTLSNKAATLQWATQLFHYWFLIAVGRVWKNLLIWIIATQTRI